MSGNGQTQDYRVICLSEAVSPITHMSRTEGNEAVVAREPVVTARGVGWVPVLSGNAIRHRCVREPGFQWLVEEYGLAGSLSLPQLNYLFHGGSLTEGGGREDTARIADWQRLFPLGRLLGGCLPDQILAGSLRVGRGTLVCEENRATLAVMMGEHASLLPDRMRAGESFVSGYQYTRSDARKHQSRLLDKATSNVETDASNLMIFAGQAVTRGAVFVHDFLMPHVSELEVGALLWSLSLWQAQGGAVGGQASRGHGRLATSIVADGFDAGAVIDGYREYARSVKEEASAWLNLMFASRADKKEAKAKGRKAKEEEPAILETD